MQIIIGAEVFNVEDYDEGTWRRDGDWHIHRLHQGNGVRIRPAFDKHFSALKVMGGCLPCMGSIVHDAQATTYIPDIKAHRRMGLDQNAHVLRDQECLTILSDSAIQSVKEPSGALVAAVKGLIKQTTHLERIEDSDRDKLFLSLFDDRMAPQNAPDGLQQDYGWLLRHWTYTMGGEARGGWYEGICPRGGGGYTNWHYETLFILILRYLDAPSPWLWRIIVESAFRHCDFGRVHEGGNKGLAQYEKGFDYIGHNFVPKAEKQWSRGLILANVLMGNNEVLRSHIDDMLEQLRSLDGYLIWQGYWGSRIPARWLDELLLYRLVFPDAAEDLELQAERLIRSTKTYLDTNRMIWPNRGSAVTTSPWMQVQLITAIMRWYEHVPALEQKTGMTKDTLCGVMHTVWDEGMVDVGKHRISKYRAWPDVAPNSIHITSFFESALRYCAAHDHAFDSLFLMTRDFLRDFAGSSLGQVYNDTPLDLLGVDFRFPPEGPGWGDKVLQMYVQRHI